MLQSSALLILLLCFILLPHDSVAALGFKLSIMGIKKKPQRISKQGHHRLNHKSTHQLSGSHSDTGLNSPHPHFVIIIRLSTKLIGVKLQWIYSTQRFRQASHTPHLISHFFCLKHTDTHMCMCIFVRTFLKQYIPLSPLPNPNPN